MVAQIFVKGFGGWFADEGGEAVLWVLVDGFEQSVRDEVKCVGLVRGAAYAEGKE